MAMLETHTGGAGDHVYAIGGRSGESMIARFEKQFGGILGGINTEAQLSQFVNPLNTFILYSAACRGDRGQEIPDQLRVYRRVIASDGSEAIAWVRTDYAVWDTGYTVVTCSIKDLSRPDGVKGWKPFTSPQEVNSSYAAKIREMCLFVQNHDGNKPESS